MQGTYSTSLFIHSIFLNVDSRNIVSPLCILHFSFNWPLSVFEILIEKICFFLQIYSTFYCFSSVYCFSSYVNSYDLARFYIYLLFFFYHLSSLKKISVNNRTIFSHIYSTSFHLSYGRSSDVYDKQRTKNPYPNFFIYLFIFFYL